MASVTTSITQSRTCPKRLDTRRHQGRACGFSLPEVVIGLGIGSIVMLGVISTFLMMGRSGANIANYTRMDAQMRRALEEFAQDIRMASNFTWNSSTSVTLTVPDNYGSTANQVTYAWDSSSSGATARSFYRMPGDVAAANPKPVLVRDVTAFSFFRYDRLNNSTVSDLSTKRVQISITVTSQSQTVATVRDEVVSASFILRNKLAT